MCVARIVRAALRTVPLAPRGVERDLAEFGRGHGEYGIGCLAEVRTLHGRDDRFGVRDSTGTVIAA